MEKKPAPSSKLGKSLTAGSADPLDSTGMSTWKKRHCRAFCVRCQAPRPFHKPPRNVNLHFALAVVTAGLWLVPWFFVTLHWRYRKPWRCSYCGARLRGSSLDYSANEAPHPENLNEDDARGADPQIRNSH
jgi:hypothetical protein